MKTAFYLALLFGALACTSQATQNKCTLDGRTFKIETFVGDKMDGTENLAFTNGKATNDVCTQYGFGDGAYTTDDQCKFRYTLTSPQEGRMDWEGQTTGASIQGKMVWIKAGQDDIHYTFKGEEVKI